MTATADQQLAAHRFTSDSRPESVVRQWEPEHQLLGALMHLSAARATPLLVLVPDHAIHHPMTRWAYELIRALVDSGRDPDPVAVLAAGRRQPARAALDPQHAPSPSQHHRLALYLADAYTHTLSPSAATSYARDVLDQAYRRSFRAQGMAMICLADAGADRDTLTDHFAAATEELADLTHRSRRCTLRQDERPR
jgi:replicative DNA helicase